MSQPLVSIKANQEQRTAFDNWLALYRHGENAAMLADAVEDLTALRADRPGPAAAIVAMLVSGPPPAPIDTLDAITQAVETVALHLDRDASDVIFANRLPATLQEAQELVRIHVPTPGAAPYTLIGYMAMGLNEPPSDETSIDEPSSVEVGAIDSTLGIVVRFDVPPIS